MSGHYFREANASLELATGMNSSLWSGLRRTGDEPNLPIRSHLLEYWRIAELRGKGREQRRPLALHVQQRGQILRGELIMRGRHDQD